ncbi:predicted protein [Enterococcus casseliflavus EC10]|nr:predicted protein [Enterococcus casseliflavus EC10]
MNGSIIIFCGFLCQTHRSFNLDQSFSNPERTAKKILTQNTLFSSEHFSKLSYPFSFVCTS